MTTRWTSQFSEQDNPRHVDEEEVALRSEYDDNLEMEPTTTNSLAKNKHSDGLAARRTAFRWILWTVVFVNALIVTKLMTSQLLDLDRFSKRTSVLLNSLSRRCEHISPSHLEWDFVPSGMCLNRTQIQTTIIDLVHLSSDKFAEYNITYWLESGTLLGAYREHGIIPYDVDADFGIDEASYLRIRDSLVIDWPEPYIMVVFNSTIHNGADRDANIPIRIIDTRVGLYVDVFVFLESKDESTGRDMIGPIASVCFRSCVRCQKHGKYKRFWIPTDWVYPLQACSFSGKEVNCPNDPEKYLDFLYGDDFMIPDGGR